MAPAPVPGGNHRSSQVIIGPVIGGAIAREAGRVGVPKEVRLTTAELTAAQEQGRAIVSERMRSTPDASVSEIANEVASSLVRQLEAQKRERL